MGKHEASVRRLAAHHAVTAVLAEASTLEEAASPVLQALCEGTGFDVGQLWLADGQEDLRCVDIWWSAEPQLAQLAKAVRAEGVARRSGLLAEALRTGEPAWATQLDGGGGVPHGDEAARAGLQAATAFPIVTRGRTVGVLIFFSREPVAPDWDLIQMIMAVGSHVAEFAERRRAERELALRDRAMAATLSGVLIIDAQGAEQPIVYANPAFERMTGYRSDEVVGRDRSFLEGADTDPHELERIAESLDDGRGVTATLVHYRRDGSPFWDELTISPVVDGVGQLTHWVVTLSDVTERKRAEEQIAYLAYHDPLTGLPNRTMFQEHLDLALARAERNGSAIAVLFMDVDNFKLINDSFGHSHGDELLVQLAGRLAGVTRSSDLVARQGGDEFLLLLPDLARGQGDDDFTPLEVTEAIVRKIKSELRAPFRLADTEVFVGVSVGVSVYPTDAGDRDALLKHADSGMYRAKESLGHGSRVFAGDETAARSHLSLTTRLRRAVDEGGFVLHYQPIVNLRSGAPVCAEALIRWQDGKRLRPPVEFIPLAERTGLIAPITDWVVQEACRQASDWRAHGLQLDVSINIPATLWRSATVFKVLSTLEAFGLEPATLTMEITESAAMDDRHRTDRLLETLRLHGVRIAIDDFGTGYSSLSRLKQLPVSTLKIDRSFVGDLPEDVDAAAIAEGIVQLARTLGLRPLAEGIETAEQRSFLLERGCELGQGFHFGAAVPPEQLIAAA